MNFYECLLRYDKENVLRITKDILDSEYGVQKFYNDYILDSISKIGNEVDFDKYDIAKEHLCSAIIRSVVEVCYEYILKERSNSCNQSVLVCGLEDELHELPPRITSDLFLLAGFDAYFLGTNIPNNDILSAVKHLNVDYLAISVTNFLHLTKLKELVNLIKKESKCKIIIGGLAVVNNSDYCKGLNVDYILSKSNDIGGIIDEISNKNS